MQVSLAGSPGAGPMRARTDTPRRAAAAAALGPSRTRAEDEENTRVFERKKQTKHEKMQHINEGRTSPAILILLGTGKSHGRQALIHLVARANARA